VLTHGQLKHDKSIMAMMKLLRVVRRCFFDYVDGNSAAAAAALHGQLIYGNYNRSVYVRLAGRDSIVN